MTVIAMTCGTWPAFDITEAFVGNVPATIAANEGDDAYDSASDNGSCMFWSVFGESAASEAEAAG